MNTENFEAVVNKRIAHITKTLKIKGKEYASDTDRLHNFYEGSKISGKSPTSVLDGMMLKHYISYRDILTNIEKGNIPPQDIIDEKIGDLINYFILFDAVVSDLRDQHSPTVTILSNNNA